MNGKKILLTGGHAGTTGIAVIEEIKKSPKFANCELFWVGSKTAIEGSSLSTLESKVLPKMQVNFIGINAGKIQTKFTKYTLSSLLKIPLGFIEGLVAVLKVKPSVVLSFGGYTSFPIVLWSNFFRIPVIIHEQTVAAGRATLASAFFANKITLARVESAKYFSDKKTIVVGDPIMKNILSVSPKNKKGNLTTILIMGGSRGSNFINELVVEIAPRLLEQYKLIHVTGEHEFEKVDNFRKTLSENLKKNYSVLAFVDPFGMGKLYDLCDIIISRSGANTVSEIMYVKKPAILIPLPRTFLAEQHKNAKYAEDFGIAKVMTENEATGASVLKEIGRIDKSWSDIVDGVRSKTSPDKDASKKIVNLLSEYC